MKTRSSEATIGFLREAEAGRLPIKQLCRRHERRRQLMDDWAALEAYGGINGALTRMSVLADACAETR